MWSKNELIGSLKFFQNKNLIKARLIDTNLLPECWNLVASDRNPVILRKVEYWGDPWKPWVQCHRTSGVMEIKDLDTPQITSSLNPPPLWVFIPFSCCLPHWLSSILTNTSQALPLYSPEHRVSFPVPSPQFSGKESDHIRCPSMDHLESTLHRNGLTLF